MNNFGVMGASHELCRVLDQVEDPGLRMALSWAVARLLQAIVNGDSLPDEDPWPGGLHA